MSDDNVVDFKTVNTDGEHVIERVTIKLKGKPSFLLDGVKTMSYDPYGFLVVMGEGESSAYNLNEVESYTVKAYWKGSEEKGDVH